MAEDGVMRWRSFLLDVPVILGAGVVGGGFAHAWVPPLAAIAIGVAVAAAIGLGLAWTHARPAVRAAYWVLLVAHLGFWTWQGLRRVGTRPAGAPQLLDAAAWDGPTAFGVGLGQASFHLPKRVSLAGWGKPPRRQALPAFGGFGPLGRWSQRWMATPERDGRSRRALFSRQDTSPHDLGARALVVRPVNGAPLAIAVADVVTVDAVIQAEVVERLRPYGFSPPGVLVVASHTHSGPGGISRRPLSAVVATDHYAPGVANAVADACIRAILDARASVQPAEAMVLRARDRDDAAGAPVLARNRRADVDPAVDADDVDDRVLGLRFTTPDGEPIAQLIGYAVHPVVLRRDHMRLDRDLVAPLEDELTARTACPTLFVNGALGDVSPRRLPGVEGAARGRALAQAFAAAVAGSLEVTSSVGEMDAAAVRVRRDLGSARVLYDLGGRAGLVSTVEDGLFSGGAGGVVADALAMPINVWLWGLGQPELRAVFRFGAGAGMAFDLGRVAGSTRYVFGAWAFRIGEERVALLWLPGEATTAIGRQWRDMAASHGFGDCLVVGLAGDACAYVTTEAEYHQDLYEARGTLFGPHTGRHVSECLDLALREARSQMGE